MSKCLSGLGYVTMWYRTLSFATRLKVFISLLLFHTQWSMDSKFKDYFCYNRSFDFFLSIVIYFSFNKLYNYKTPTINISLFKDFNSEGVHLVPLVLTSVF